MTQTKEQHREYMRLKRGSQKGSQEARFTTKGSQLEKWYPNKKTDEHGRPITPVKLSDGQLWYPRANINDGIERYGTVRGDLEARRARAARYNTNEPALLSAIVNDRKRLESITAELKSHNQLDNVRYGLSGPTMGQLAEMLEITAG